MTNKNIIPLAYKISLYPEEIQQQYWRMPQVVPPGICPVCETPAGDSNKVSFAGHDWHKACMKCSACQKSFQDLNIMTKDDLILHPDCFKQIFCERCARCGNPVDPNQTSKAGGRCYHSQCFTCVSCGKALTDKFKSLFTLPYCDRCYKKTEPTLPHCISCKEAIISEETITPFFFRGKKYCVHSGQCLKCSCCSANIFQNDCCVYSDQLVCKKCVSKAMKKICAECNEPIFGEALKMDNIYYHVGHFKCKKCGTEMRPNTCVVYLGEAYCRTCAADVRQKCAGCGEVLERKPAPISACGRLWHQQCVKCQDCKENLVGRQITNVGGVPYCFDCFQRLKNLGKLDKWGQIIESDQ